MCNHFLIIHNRLTFQFPSRKFSMLTRHTHTHGILLNEQRSRNRIFIAYKIAFILFVVSFQELCVCVCSRVVFFSLSPQCSMQTAVCSVCWVWEPIENVRIIVVTISNERSGEPNEYSMNGNCKRNSHHRATCSAMSVWFCELKNVSCRFLEFQNDETIAANTNEVTRRREEDGCFTLNSNFIWLSSKICHNSPT